MSNEEWNIIYEQLRPVLKQGFEAIAEGGIEIVTCQIGYVTQNISPEVEVQSKLVCFLATETAAAILEGTAGGYKRMQEIAVDQIQQAVMAGQSNTSMIIKPS
jgi:hypothetical protein